MMVFHTNATYPWVEVCSASNSCWRYMSGHKDLMIDASIALIFEMCIGSSAASPSVMVASHGNQLYM